MKIQQTTACLTASLPMYDWPEVQADNDAFWTTLRQALDDYGFRGLPTELTRSNKATPWSEGNIGFTQTCGFPLKHELGSMVDLLGTPLYDADYCQDGLYASVIVIREDDRRSTFGEFRNATPAINSVNSQSGYNALLNYTHSMMPSAPTTFFNKPVISGAHALSITAVARQQADLCAIDPVSWRLAQCFRRDALSLRVLCHTSYTPALPLVCSTAIAHGFAGSLGRGADALRKTVELCWQEAISSDSVTAQNLFLKGITTIERDAYLAVPTLTPDTIAHKASPS